MLGLRSSLQIQNVICVSPSLSVLVRSLLLVLALSCCFTYCTPCGGVIVDLVAVVVWRISVDSGLLAVVLSFGESVSNHCRLKLSAAVQGYRSLHMGSRKKKNHRETREGQWWA